MPLEVVCTECDGDDPECESCDGQGVFLVTQCPTKEIGEDISDMCPLADLFKEGLPPCAGGSRDQSHWFVQAASRLCSDENKIEQSHRK